MLKNSLVGSRKISISDFVNFEADEDSFELIDIVNSEPIKPGEDFATVQGFFVYEIDLDIDMQKALDERLEGIEIKVYPENPVRTVLKNLDPYKRASEAKSMFARQKEFSESVSQEPIYRAILPVHSKLPNDLVNDGINNQDIKAATSRMVVMTSDQVSTDSQVSSTPLLAKITTPISALSGAKKNLGLIQSEIIRDRKIDPASLINTRTPLTVQTARSFQNYSNTNQNAGIYSENRSTFTPVNIARSEETSFSLISSFSESKRSIVEIRKKELEKINKITTITKVEEAKIVNTLLRSAESISQKDSSSNVSTNEAQFKILGFQVVIESQIKNHKFNITLPKFNIGTKNYIYFSLKPIIKDADKKGIVPEETHYSVSHKSQVEKLMIPIVAPKITITSDQLNRISFSVKQLDPAANTILITKRVVNPNFRDEGFAQFKKLSVGQAQEIEIVDDNPENTAPNSVIYRAISLYHDSLGSFDSVLFEGKKVPFIPSSCDPLGEMSMISRNLQDGIQIELDRFPLGTMAISLYKEDLMTSGSIKNRTSLVKNRNTDRIFDVRSTQKLSILDLDVVEGRSYRYYALLYFGNGIQKISSEDELVVRKKPASEFNNPFLIEISSMQPRQTENNFYEVASDVKLTPKDSSFQFIKQIFSEQNILSEFEGFINENKEKMDQLMALKVERIDRNTGKRYDLGIHRSGEFVDGMSLSRNLGIPLVVPGGRYIYNFRVCLINPLSVFYDTISKLSSGRNPGFRDVSFNPNLFNNVSLNRGILPSNRSMVSQPKFNDAIVKGDIGITIRREITVPKLRAYIGEIKLSVTRRNTILYWEIVGDPSEVDYAIVEVNLRGDSQVLTSVAASGGGSRMMAVDHRYSNEVGQRYYSVSLVYNDGSFSTAKLSETLDNSTDVKPRVLQNAMLSNQATISSLIKTADSKLSSFGSNAQIKDDLRDFSSNNGNTRRF